MDKVYCIFGRGFKCSLNHDTKYFLKVPTFFNNRCRVTVAYRQHVQYLGKHLDSSLCHGKYVAAFANQSNKPSKHFLTNCTLSNTSVAYYGTSAESKSSTKSTVINKDCYKQPSVFQRMKQMTKDYWHILVPVHVVTSIGWITIFYAAAKNGVDIVRILESLNLNGEYVDVLKNSSAGNWAVTYALYKIFTPVRYTVTVGGTTMFIRYLRRLGYIDSKKSSMLKESAACAKEHKTQYSTPSSTNKVDQQLPPKT